MSPDAILHRRLAALQDWAAAPTVVVLDEQPEDQVRATNWSSGCSFTTATLAKLHCSPHQIRLCQVVVWAAPAGIALF